MQSQPGYTHHCIAFNVNFNSNINTFALIPIATTGPYQTPTGPYRPMTSQFIGKFPDAPYGQSDYDFDHFVWALSSNTSTNKSV